MSISSAQEICVIDYETHPIMTRPNYPPTPVGVAIESPWMKPTYFGWGHPTENNCHPDDALAEIDKIWASGLPILFHNAKFDLAVCYEKGGFHKLPWERVHDSQFIAFLIDPHARSLGLKELAEDLLDWPPDEQDAISDWVLSHKKRLVETWPEYRKLSPKSGKPIDNIAPSDTGKWIFATPGGLCGEYAIGDIKRTRALFEEYYPVVLREGMGEAYDRERRLLPILMENEEIGMRVDMDLLEQDCAAYGEHMRFVEDWMRDELSASGLNFDADRDVASVLSDRDVVSDENWTLTESGQKSMKKDVLLPEHFNDPRIASALGYRNRLKTCLKMFMQPWLEQADQWDGHIGTNWNQVRSPGGGTRTGRPSTNKHNFLNISKSFEGRTDGYEHPHFLGVDELPLVRKYVLADEGGVIQHRDFDGQEMRIFGHYEEGDLLQAYLKNPELDVHGFVGDNITEIVNVVLERTKVKAMNFQGLYGGGAPALSRELHCSMAEAKEFKAFHNKALPGRVILNEEIKRIVRRGDPIRTWGGRIYFPEEPKVIKGRRRNFEYKLINYLIQGSAADITKEALCQWYEANPKSRFLVTVYDEINISSPEEHAEAEMILLRLIMEQAWIDVPMLSSGKRGPAWGELEKGA